MGFQFHCRKILHQNQHEKFILCSPATVPAPAPSSSPLQPPTLQLPITPRIPIPFVPLSDEGLLHTHLIHVAMIVVACTVAIVLLLCTISIIRRKYYSSRHNHNHVRGNTPILFYVNGDSPVTASDDDDDDHGHFIEHPIWFIRTVGLQQSVIDSITVFKYKNDEGLIDGTECSVCLGEFQEEESLRLLPKCSHAFHIPCIDTWLRSHKNCPLCRAPVVHDDGGGSGSGSNEVRVTDPDSIVSGESQETTTQMGNFDGGVLGNNHLGESESDDVGLLNSEDGASVLIGSYEVEEEEIQHLRRSVSMDSCTASMMVRDVVLDLNSDQEGLDSQLGDKTSSSSKNVKIDKHHGSGSSTSTICKLASIGRVLQKRPISLRSSFSHNRKSLSSRHSRSQSSTLPL